MDSILSCCLLFVSFWMVSGTPGHFASPHHKEKSLDHYAVPKYHYAYGVFDKWSGDMKHVEEQRHGGWTRGGYSLLQPNGEIRSVKYTADPWNGFKAAVHNFGWVGNGHGHSIKSSKNPHSHYHHHQHQHNHLQHTNAHGINEHGNGWGWGWAPQSHQHHHHHQQPLHHFHGHVINHGYKHTHPHSHPLFQLPVVPVSVKGFIGHSIH